MNKIISFIFTFIFVIAIGAIVFIIATISITNKINSDKQRYQQGIFGVVEKQAIPIVGFSDGIIKEIYVNQGQDVKEGDLLVEIENPLLLSQYESLQSYSKNNVSAQTQAAIAKSELDNNKIYSPVNGTVDTVNVSKNSPIDQYAKIVTIFANDNTKILAYLTTDQYVVAQKLKKISAYNVRLNQDISISPDILKPNQVDPMDASSSKIALYFKLSNPQDSLSLLNGEQLQLKLAPQDDELIKPLDYVVNFWNLILSNNNDSK